MKGIAKQQDPVNASPKTHKTIFEDDRIRILDIHIKPGEKSPMHSHPAYVAIALEGKCKVRFTSPDGEKQDVEFEAGQSASREPEAHTVENIGDAVCHALNVELKEAVG